MQWKKIDKSKRKQPTQGNYTDWKQQIADECNNHCVYCSIHEGPWGGIDHYHIDHFRPKSKPEFTKLKNIITNLYYACPICNRFKHDDWPGEPDSLDKICYPDPSDHDYTDLFTFDNGNFTISGAYMSSKYLVNRLYLNRPQLIYERREATLKSKAELLIRETVSLIKTIKDDDFKVKALAITASMVIHLQARDKIRPYKLVEIRKP